MSLTENYAIDGLSLSMEEGVMRVGFNRPSHKNAITGAMYLGLARAFEAAEADQAVRVVVLHGSDDIFTAGNDIGDFLTHRPEPGELPSGLFMKAMLRSTKPIIAGVNGPAVGIGATMLLHCDLVYVGATAKLVFPFTKLGLCPEFASTVLLPGVLGHQRASRLLLLGDSCNADEACRLGLANEVLPPSEVLSHAMSVAARLAQMSPASIQATKSLIRSGQVTVLEQQIDEEGAMFKSLLASPQAKAAFEGFLRKKEAVAEENALDSSCAAHQGHERRREEQAMNGVSATEGQVQEIGSARPAVAIEGERAQLVREWLEYFGVEEPMELDLGTLMAIHEWVVDGLRPSLRESR